MPKSDRDRWMELLSYIQALIYHERETTEQARLQEQIVESVETDEHRKELSMLKGSFADELITKGRRKGREAGRKEGLRSGELRGRKKTLLEQLELRFGKPSQEILKAIEAEKDEERIAQWSKKLIVADSVDDLGIV